MRWKVQLEGHETGLEELSEAFDQDPRIFGDDGEYYLWSSKFEQLDESGEVKDIGENIVKIVRQLGEFDSLRVEELYVSCVIEIQEDGSERKIVHASAAVTATATTSVRVSVDGEEPPPRAESTYEYTQLALKDDKVQELMELRGNGITGPIFTECMNTFKTTLNLKIISLNTDGGQRLKKTYLNIQPIIQKLSDMKPDTVPEVLHRRTRWTMRKQRH